MTVDPFQYATRGEEAVSLWEFSLPQMPTAEPKVSSVQETESKPVSAAFSDGFPATSVVQKASVRGSATKAYVTRILDWRWEVPAACALAHSILEVVYGVRDASRVSAGDVELVALVPDGWLPLAAKHRLSGCGYRVQPVPQPRSIPRYLGVPLAAWSLTEYRAVIFMEPTSLVLSPSIQELFHCGCFCAPVQTGEYFSTGVFGLRPSARVHARMLQVLKRDVLGEPWPSSRQHPRKELLWHEAGQSLSAFLNAFMRDFLRAPYFPQKVPAERIDEDDAVYGELMRTCCDDPVLLVSSLRLATDPAAVCVRRLPIGYDGDPVFHGVFSNTRVIRFAPPFTPYAWWSRWFIGNKAAWRASQRAFAGSHANSMALGPWAIAVLGYNGGLGGSIAIVGLVLYLCMRVARNPSLAYHFLIHSKAYIWRRTARVSALLHQLSGRYPIRGFLSRVLWRKRCNDDFVVKDPESRGFTDKEDVRNSPIFPKIPYCGSSALCGLLSGLLTPCIAWFTTPTFLPSYLGIPLFASLCATLQSCSLNVLRLHFQRIRVHDEHLSTRSLSEKHRATRRWQEARDGASGRGPIDSTNHHAVWPNIDPADSLYRSCRFSVAASKVSLLVHFLWWILVPEIPILVTRNMRVVIAMWGSFFFIYAYMCSLIFHQIVAVDWTLSLAQVSMRKE
ncbi:hypothetical protein F1559_000616 [Cyanidiococcus yangmingshanensis]|uniref:Uncharacterized protein n=1 Tax=Cyanidiococcus yangmingshanensis TaxID=2690220 RepID=A0A7J7IPV9_9RHOD|nr:hypothetical protein F1559_000616 [Cyanidiococcus yangmingshanensis]